MKPLQRLWTVSCFLALCAVALIPAAPIAKGDADARKKDKLPLEVGRTFQLTTDEGSWISLDVAPDGKTIVFDLLGDLYQVAFEGGEAHALTTGMAFDAQPRFSPDGKEIVFTSDRDGGENLWILNLESGKPRQLTKGKGNRYQSPEWTPDGTYVVASRAALRGGFPKLWLFHKDGGTGIQLTKEPRTQKNTGAAFGPDGRYIWMAERDRDWQYNAIFPQYQLAVYDRETGKRHTESSRFGSAFRPTLSTDGKWLAYGTRHDAQTGIRLRDLASGEERWLAYPVQHDDQESRGSRDALPGMSFTPDGSELVLSYGGKIWRVPVDGGPAIPVPFQVTAQVEMGPRVQFDYPVDDAAEFAVHQIRDAVPSPDGSRLAFTALNRLYVVDGPDAAPRRIGAADYTEAQPAWSPDGKSIAFVTWEGQGGHVYRIDAEGGTPLRLTQTAGIYQQPAWSPDGERIVFIEGSAQSFREADGAVAPRAADKLAWVPSSGGETVAIMPVEDRRRPHFSWDAPDRIYLHSEDEGLVSVRWDGSDEKKHLKVSGDKMPGAERAPKADLILMAPRGDRAIVQMDNHLFLVTVPYVGGETPEITLGDPDKAPVPARKLTEIGGQFPAWSQDAKKVHWSIGDAHVVYDLEEARRVEEASAAEPSEEPKQDESGADKEESEEGEKSEKPAKKKPAYKPAETRYRVTARRDLPTGSYVLRGARLISMKGDEIIENSEIVIRGHRIAAVGRAGSVEIPKDAKIMDVSGKTVMPGFVDVHAHMRPSWGIHKSQVWTYLANLAFGVTTTRDPQTSTTDVLTYSDMVETGQLLGPRIYSTGPGVFYSEQIKDLDHARNVLKRYSQYYDTKTIKMYVAGNREQRQWIIQAAREQELMPTTEGSLDLKLNLTQLLDGYPGHEHSFPVFPLYKDVLKLAVESGVTYTPTLLVAYGGPWAENYFYATEDVHGNEKLRRFTPHSDVDRKTRRRGQGTGPGPGGWFMDEEHVFPQLAKFVKDLVEAGGRVGVGSHGQLQGLGYHWELWAMQSGGLSNHDALRAATLHGADAIGLDGDLGSVEPGKLADLLVLDANPLQDIRNSASVRYVVKNGRLYESATLDQILPEARTLGPLEWQNDEPDTAAGVGR